MGDPLTALGTLGTVSNIIQVLEFSAKVIKQIQKVASGAQDTSEDAKRIEELAAQYQKLNINICEHSRYSKPLTASEAAVEELANKSRGQAKAILKLVNTLKVKESSRGVKRAFDGGFKVVKTAVQRHKLEEHEKQLHLLNEQLGTSFLKLLHQNLSSFHKDLLDKLDSLGKQDGETKRTIDECKYLLEKIESLGSRDGDAIDAIVDSRDKILGAISKKRRQEEKSVAKVLDKLAFAEMGTRRNNISPAYEKTYEWVFTETAWGLRDWLSSDASLFWISGKAGSGKSTLVRFLLQHPKTKQLLSTWAGDDLLSLADFYFWYLGTCKLQKSEEGLLRSILHQILLECPYFIPDVCSAERWSEAMHSWICSQPWTKDELYGMLNRLASAGPILLNSEKRDDNPVTMNASAPALLPSYDHTAKQRKFVLFIDGLDEYTGDQLRLTRQIKRLAANPCIKICVSSRPENVFNMAFGEIAPVLRLEDLTRPDIEQYVRGNILDALSESGFRSHWNQIPQDRRSSGTASPSSVDKDAEHGLDAFSDTVDENSPVADEPPEFTSEDQDDPSEFITQIVSKASGVFLWVYLAVENVIDGIVEGDSIAMLSKRVDILPPDLYEYFKLTLSRVNAIYAQQTASVLLIAKTIASKTSMTGASADSFLTYWLLRQSDEGVRTDFTLPVRKVSLSTMLKMRNKLQQSLSACCKDLLQLRRGNLDHCSWDHELYYPGVEFLHRTVYEFLCSEEMELLLAKHEKPYLQDRIFWKRLAAARLKFVPSPSQGQPQGECTCSQDSSKLVGIRIFDDEGYEPNEVVCWCSHYFRDAAFVSNYIHWFKDRKLQRAILADLETTSEQWLKLRCPKKCQYPDELLSNLAQWKISRPLLILLPRQELSWKAATRLLSAILGLGVHNPFAYSEIDLHVLRAALERISYRDGVNRDDGSTLTIWETFWQKVGEEVGIPDDKVPDLAWVIDEKTREIRRLCTTWRQS